MAMTSHVVVLLASVLPSELARLVVQQGAAVQLQAAVRGTLVRVRRRPRGGDRFGLVDLSAGGGERVGAYDYSGAALGADLEAWMGGWRPGPYAIELSVRHADGVSSVLEAEAVVVPRGVRWTESLLDSWAMYQRAFAPVYGPPCAHRVAVEAL
jgi:hypothetical protein